MKKLLSFISLSIVLLPLFTINAYALTLEEQKDSVAPSHNQADDGYTKKLLSKTLYQIGTLVDNTVRGCAPDALVNVLGYWNDKGCKIFEADGAKIYCKDIDYNSSEPVEELLNTAKNNFRTIRVRNTEWTLIWNYESGISKTLSDYKLSGTVNCYYFSKITFDLIKNEIDNDRPCIVSGSSVLSSNFNGHTVCVIGYKIANSVSGKNYLIYVDSSGIDKEQVWYPNISTNIGILCTINLQCSSTTTTASGQRFTDNGNGTVTDKRTGLIWLKNVNPFEPKNWYDAGTYCSSLASGQAGLTDGSTAGQWRLPSKEELEGIGTDPPATWPDGPPSVTWTKPGTLFTGVQIYVYWSSTEYAGYPAYAWFVSMDDGIVDSTIKSNFYDVWAVRGGN